MNPLIKALGTVLVLAAGALGTSLDHGIPLPVHRTSEGDASGGDGNSTGNETGDGNQTAGDGNETSDGNSTADDDQATDDNETAGDGNQTAGDGNGTADNETADPEPVGEEAAAVCSYSVDEWGDDLTPSHHEWEWLVTSDVKHLAVDFEAYGGVPAGLGSQPDIRLVDGNGRTLAHSGSGDTAISIDLERGVDYLASGQWRLLYDSSDVFSDYYAEVHLDC